MRKSNKNMRWSKRSSNWQQKEEIDTYKYQKLRKLKIKKAKKIRKMMKIKLMKLVR